MRIRRSGDRRATPRPCMGPVVRQASVQRKNPAFLRGFREEVAERTGLEPATSGVTGQHSNQLNYRSAFFCNSRTSCAVSLPVALHLMASPRGFEPLLLP